VARNTLVPAVYGRQYYRLASCATLLPGSSIRSPLRCCIRTSQNSVTLRGRVPFIDHCSKYCIGWAVGEYGDTDLALVAWDSAVERLQELGIAHQGLIVHHDRGSVFTSYKWTSRLLLDDRVRVSYALGGAKDNPEMESFNSRFKTENRSLLREPGSLEELIEIVNSRMRYYNEERRHSTLGNQAPLTWLRSWFKET